MTRTACANTWSALDWNGPRLRTGDRQPASEDEVVLIAWQEDWPRQVTSLWIRPAPCELRTKANGFSRIRLPFKPSESLSRSKSLILNGARAGIEPATRGFSGLAFFHQNNGFAPEWLFCAARKISRLRLFSRTIRTRFAHISRSPRAESRLTQSPILSDCEAGCLAKVKETPLGEAGFRRWGIYT